MTISLRTLVAASAVIFVSTGVAAQGVAIDAEPDIGTKLKALQIYMEDGSAALMAQACAETIPNFLSEFQPKFIDWRSANSKLIALGATLSSQFKDPAGKPMDPIVLGRAAAERVRTIAPDERSRECGKLLQDLSVAD